MFTPEKLKHKLHKYFYTNDHKAFIQSIVKWKINTMINWWVCPHNGHSHNNKNRSTSDIWGEMGLFLNHSLVQLGERSQMRRLHAVRSQSMDF